MVGPVAVEPFGSAAPKDGYPTVWDGHHCPFAYTYTTLVNFPPVPTFRITLVREPAAPDLPKGTHSV